MFCSSKIFAMSMPFSEYVMPCQIARCTAYACVCLFGRLVKLLLVVSLLVRKHCSLLAKELLTFSLCALADLHIVWCNWIHQLYPPPRSQEQLLCAAPILGCFVWRAYLSVMWFNSLFWWSAFFLSVFYIPVYFGVDASVTKIIICS